VLAVSEGVDTRQALLERLAEARTQTDALFDLVTPDALYERPIPERHRIIFYLGHLEAFDWNLLRERITKANAFDPELDRLFAFGIDPVDGGLPSDQPADWPAQAQIEQYRNRVRTSLDAALAERSFMEWEGDESPVVLLNVAIEHRLMHAETLAYILHQLPYDKKLGTGQIASPQAGPLRTGMIEIPRGAVTLGMPRDGVNFGWDNEFEATTYGVRAFRIDRYKTTNGEYLKFVEAGGYQQKTLWSAGDWDWKETHGITHPLLWRRMDRTWSRLDKTWSYRGMFQEIPLPLEWPVYVSHAEAAAYAHWANKRLPTEAEWQRAAYGTPEGAEQIFPWGDESPDRRHGYFGLGRWDPSPVNAFPSARSAFGVEGLLANGWEWTSSLFEPLTGFQPFPFYAGYSASFFDGTHYVIKGGSPRTDQCMLRRTFRNWFQPHYQYAYAGFRCAEP
jgi:iron(II)-dependent oxidoreductase